MKLQTTKIFPKGAGGYGHFDPPTAKDWASGTFRAGIGPQATPVPKSEPFLDIRSLQ
jgi:hypothetical protein